MMMSRLSYRERQPGGHQRVLQKRNSHFRVFDRPWPPVFATLFRCLGTSDFRASFQPR